MFAPRVSARRAWRTMSCSQGAFTNAAVFLRSCRFVLTLKTPVGRVPQGRRNHV